MSEELDLYTNGNDTVVATCPATAIAVWDEHYGDDWHAGGYGGAEDWEKIDGDKLVGICQEDVAEAPDMPEGATVSEVSRGWSVSAKARHWAAHSGRGWLCSYDW